MAKKVVDERLNNTDLAGAVLTHLASIGRAIKGKPKTKDDDKTPKSEPDMYEVLIDTSKTVATATQAVTGATDIAHVAESGSQPTGLGSPTRNS
jgi:hypothetical protein